MKINDFDRKMFLIWVLDQVGEIYESEFYSLIKDISEKLKELGYDMGYSFYESQISPGGELRKDILILSKNGHIKRGDKYSDYTETKNLNVTKRGKFYLELLKDGKWTNSFLKTF